MKKFFIRLKSAFIIRWEYFPGQRLTEESLRIEFGVSRVPVREALRMLEDNQLVDKIPYRGCTVKQPDLEQINQLYDVRLALELFVVEQLAGQGLPPDIGQELLTTWNSLLPQQAADIIDSLRLARLDEAFHEGLARATGNTALADLLHSVNERLYFVRMTDITTIERLQITCNQHLDILACIQRQEVAAARTAVRTNIDYGRKNVEQVLRSVLVQMVIGK